MKINKYLPFALLYFFLNTVGLPFGLTWMALLGPFFYVWVLLKRKTEVLLPFLAVMLPFIIIHLLVVGVDLGVYAVSMVNYILVYLFCQGFYTFLKVCEDPEIIFRRILVINFICCLVGILFYFTPWSDIFWIQQDLTKGVERFKRFKLFTYEASYYATLFIPVFFYYLLEYVFKRNKIPAILLLPMLFLPFLLSFSIGVMAAALISCILTSLLYFRVFAKKKRIVNAVIYTGAGAAITLTVLILYFRNNVLFTRIKNIFSGADTSARGRTSEAFVIANKLLEEKNKLWGIGSGQVKVLGYDIVNSYYLYTKEYVATIPNAMAETLAIFGWAGFSLKLIIEIALFFLSRTWNNYYRLLLFFFIFIYQFTGSFMTNMAEFVIWILAFTPVFRQFDANPRVEAPSASPVHTDQ